MDREPSPPPADSSRPPPSSPINAVRQPLQFLNISNPHDLQSEENRRRVRSQAARLKPAGLPSDESAPPPRRRRKRIRSRRLTFDIDLSSSSPIAAPPGGGWAGPFASLARRTDAFAPVLTDFYLKNIATDVAELDAGWKKGMLRSKWFPMALTEQAIYSVVLLTSATHYLKQHRFDCADLILLKLKETALQHLNEIISDPGRCTTDQALGAVAKMAYYEAMFGTPGECLVHMAGLRMMLTRRGGVEALGLDGFLTRVLIYVDVHAHRMVNTPLHVAAHGQIGPGQALPPPDPAICKVETAAASEEETEEEEVEVEQEMEEEEDGFAKPAALNLGGRPRRVAK